MNGSHNLTVAQVADYAGCHVNTVKRYEKRGFLNPLRDVNGFRRFSASEARKLKELLAIRRPSGAEVR